MAKSYLRWQSQPTTTGYYWMSWKRRYARRWSYEVVYVWEGTPDEVRRPLEGWVTMDTVRVDCPRAMFYGPIEMPERS